MLILMISLIETAGTWHEMAIELTQEIGRRITTIMEDTRDTTFLFQCLSMALQRLLHVTVLVASLLNHTN